MFAIALGETGTDFSQYPGDTQTLLDLASYVSLANGADDGKHNAITSVFWWAWNANSGQGIPNHWFAQFSVNSCAASALWSSS